MKKAVRILLFAALCAFVLSACGKKEAEVKEENKTEAESSVASETKEEADDGKDAEEVKEEETSEPEEFDPAKLSYTDRFLSGNRNVFFIAEDENMDQVIRCTDENESILYAGGDGSIYYVLINDGHMKYTLYYWKEGDERGSIDLELGNDISVYHTAAYKDRFYYDYYDGEKDEYPVWSFDPEKNEFSRETSMETMRDYLDAYKGKKMSALDYRSFIPEDLKTTGYLLRRDTESGTVYAFDEEGNEKFTVSATAEDGSWDVLNDTYLIQHHEEYAGSGRVSHETATVYNVKTGISHLLWEGESDTEGFASAQIKDGYFYYYIEEINPDGSMKCRKYYREKEEELEQKDLNGQLIVEIPEWSGVISGYVYDGTSIPDGFSPKGRRAYYLWFDDEAESKTRGDISWRALDMESSGEDAIKTGAVERHESFADFGYVETEKDAKTKDNFRYFTTSRDRFYFYDDVKNASVMNTTLKEKYDEMTRYANDTEESAYNDVFGQDAVYDLDDPDAWAPSYSYDVNLGNVQAIGSRYLEVCLSDYSYYGGAHGMPGVIYYLFDKETGNTVTIRDLFHGSEKEFRDIIVKYSMDDWKNSDDQYKYYESYDPSLENEKKKEFEDIVSFDMTIDFEKEGINAVYSPYAVGPFASGFIDVFIPYSALGIEVE